MALEIISAMASEVYLSSNASVAVADAADNVSIPPLPKPVDYHRPFNLGKKLPVTPQIIPQRGNHFFVSEPRRSPQPSRSGKSRALFSQAARRALARVLRSPRTLSHILFLLSWRDFHALCSACREFRQQFTQYHACRDVILGHFVPGYREALQIGDLQQYREIVVDFHDLTMLVTSQYVPLHKYPMHSLFILHALQQPAGGSGLHEMTHKFVALTQAHSRFVLLLQSLVHSSPSSPASSSDESEDTLGFLASSQPRSAVDQFPGVRELVFPAPLSYFGSDHTSDIPVVDGIPHAADRRHRRLHSSASSTSTLRAVSLSPTRPSAELHLTYGHMSQGKRKSHLRVPIFGGKPKFPPPPPKADPPALKFYSVGWRRSRMVSQKGMQRRMSSVSDDEAGFGLRLPTRHFKDVNVSRESSLSNPSRSSSSKCNTDSTDSPPSIQARMEGQHASSMAAFAVPRGTSPHDLFLATCRTRAPVLRTFVPCTELDEHAIAACEEQLVDAGLWEHLSVGDIVCNFGYVPPPEGDIPDVAHTGEDRQKWLLFDGYGLVQYAPPGPPPLENPLTLPSPFYYAHILPPFSNPVHNLALPAHPRSSGKGYHDPHMQLTLAHLPTRVRSPKSPSGFAVVYKYVWLARLPYVGSSTGIDPGLTLGKAWQGEWMLEGEGTREGRQSLLDALMYDPSGHGFTRRGQWEIVRDRSGGGRLWMRLLIPNVDNSPSAHLDAAGFVSEPS